jgi:hypothetical protein
MERENTNTIPSYVGPLGRAEDSADQFISGMIYCHLLEQLLKQQTAIDATLKRDGDFQSMLEAREVESGLEQVWAHVMEIFNFEA